ncbi:hypothetical protein ZOSMA_70G00820 [Zostera marina]|uniref:Uncharacterized protein n=1 Tax=Zostera marina TaxID=29655 RepID=A0A0K9NR36_ZOSMR|nr:hypothetical protein ZOSMA_70G00820 [Zostera marina]
MAALTVKAEGILCASYAAAAGVYSMVIASFAERDTSVEVNSLKTPPGRKLGSDAMRFVPRFDGLRFIETLVTAHR